MIKVFYSGYGKTLKYYRDYDDDTFNPLTLKSKYDVDDSTEHRNFLLPPIQKEQLDIFGIATVNYLLDILREENGEIGEIWFFVLTDKDGNPGPFEIVKGQDIYRHENGNALKLIFDDASPVQQDVAPAEKPLNPKEKSTMLNIIHGLLEIAKKGTGKSQAEIINKLENYGYRGLKKSTLEKYFSEANKIHQRG